MLARYLGSKQSILEPLIETISDYAPAGGRVVDAFSGSLAVSLGLKRAGFSVTANDVNLFSAVLGEAYLLPSEPPLCDAQSVIGGRRAKFRLAAARSRAEDLQGQPGFTFLSNQDWFERYVNFLLLQGYLQDLEPRDLAAQDQRTYFYDAYCEEGRHSAFVSARGTTGRRRFFTPSNAKRIDLAINAIRRWHLDGVTNSHTHALLLSTLMRAVEKTSNTQGTYHDFPRSRWDPRALSPLSFEPPALDGVVCGVGGHMLGYERDSLEFVSEADEHDVLYLDPPYNFRQYTAYYFMPNVLCRYPDLADLDGYFDGLRFVRGQNPDDDFTSTFCKPAMFIDDMRTLIQRARCKTVVISYFTGRNHWSSFDSGPDDIGRQRLCDLLSESMFETGTLSVKAIPRRNYASYGGYSARTVDELILVARKLEEDGGDESEACVEQGVPILAR